LQTALSSEVDVHLAKGLMKLASDRADGFARSARGRYR
jgi:hypothetical protein